MPRIARVIPHHGGLYVYFTATEKRHADLNRGDHILIHQAPFRTLHLSKLDTRALRAIRRREHPTRAPQRASDAPPRPNQ